MKHALSETVAVLAASLGVACGGTSAAFEPAHPTGNTGATFSTTAYELRVGPSVVGDAVVWSEGAPVSRPNGGELIDVEMAIHNASTNPIELDLAKSGVNLTAHDGSQSVIGNPARVWGSRTVLPDSTRRVAIHYALPAGVLADDVASFVFNWHVASVVGDYAQSTAFVPVPPHGAETFGERATPCSGVYRLSAVEECVCETPPYAPPPR
jgi:hypothetical protein